MSSRQATIVTDLGFGDAGKGTIVDFLARQSKVAAVIRFNGGGQAAHNVVTADGRHHIFSQFGSGTFVNGVRTHLSRFMLVDPAAMAKEAEHLSAIGCGNVFARLSVDADAKIVTPFHKAINRLRETSRGHTRHGTCGMGIGETMADHVTHPELTIYVRDLRDLATLTRKLKMVQAVKIYGLRKLITVIGKKCPIDLLNECDFLEETDAPENIAMSMKRVAMNFTIVSNSFLKRLAGEGDLLFEGAQGVLLDEWYGFHPHTTWSTTTFSNALEVLNEINYAEPINKIGVFRAYFTRHGAGPFPTENKKLALLLPEPHNGNGGIQGVFRVGWFDLVLARYAIKVCGGVDALAITNLDRWHDISNRKIAIAYRGQKNIIIPKIPIKTELTDLRFQEAITGMLKSIHPVYKEVPRDNVDYLKMLALELGVPVVITSYGPTAEDKLFETPFRQ